MAFDCSCGSSFVLGGHLWVVITEPSGSPKQVIIVNLTSRKRDSDTTVVLSPEDHSFVKHDTVISYADARISGSAEIVTRIEQRDFEPRKKFRDDVIRKIQNGLLASPRTPKYIKTFFTEYLTNQYSLDHQDNSN